MNFTSICPISDLYLKLGAGLLSGYESECGLTLENLKGTTPENSDDDVPNFEAMNMLTALYVLMMSVKLISAMKARTLISHGCQGFLASVMDTSLESPNIENLSVIREFADVFFRRTTCGLRR
ncbi:hypothetical protein Tco_0695985 [Tanacetum coccineum]